MTFDAPASGGDMRGGGGAWSQKQRDAPWMLEIYIVRRLDRSHAHVRHCVEMPAENPAVVVQPCRMGWVAQRTLPGTKLEMNALLFTSAVESTAPGTATQHNAGTAPSRQIVVIVSSEPSRRPVLGRSRSCSLTLPPRAENLKARPARSARPKGATPVRPPATSPCQARAGLIAAVLLRSVAAGCHVSTRWRLRDSLSAPAPVQCQTRRGHLAIICLPR
ncbi:hypothetical protein LX36DRAFT_259862 [Colletotrichum falcatum]|nr:hypothetical protein LX36DRAFT_259862 [Colletotrichum falcatum]